MIKSPRCLKHPGEGFACGYCEDCGRKFKYFHKEDGQPILHIVSPSIDDIEVIVELCKINQGLKDLAEPFKLADINKEEENLTQLTNELKGDL